MNSWIATKVSLPQSPNYGFLMTRNQLAQKLDVLIEEEPTYSELVKLHEEIRSASVETSHERISQWALCQVFGEIIQYLDFIEEELEKAIGLCRTDERKRILREIQEPDSDNMVERINDVIEQWESFERYTYENITFTGEQETANDGQASSRLVNLDL